MKKKSKISIILLIAASLILCVGITYSVFTSNAELNSIDQNIAKFIFNAETLDELELSLMDLIPGDTKEFNFAVTNSDVENISDVTVEYQLTIKTYHLVPLIIELYKLNEEEEELVIICDENYSRNAQNELVCNVPYNEMTYNDEEVQTYRLKVTLPAEYSDEIYSQLIDYIDIDINSWQKIES